MSDDFQLTWHPRPISLGDFHLRLDPAIEAQIRVLTAGPAPPTFSPSLRAVALMPQWSMLSPSYLDRLLATPPPRARPRRWSPAAPALPSRARATRPSPCAPSGPFPPFKSR